MKAKEKRILLVVALAFGLSGGVLWGASEATSSPLFVHIDTAPNSFWRTASGPVVSLPIAYPKGAESASLAVRGAGGYAADYVDVAAGTFELTLPAASAPHLENVYDLTLTFDEGTVQTAKIAVLDGAQGTGSGKTRCISSVTARKWTRAAERAVLPIPYGTTSLTVNGETVATGLNGAQGWYALAPIAIGAGYALGLSTDAGTYSVGITGVPAAPGTLLLVK